MNLNTRNANLSDIRDLLMQRRAVAHDLVVPATAIRSRNGVLHVKGAEQEITRDGVTTVDGRYRPTDQADAGIADKLEIPVGYLRKLRTRATDVYDSNVNGLLHGRTVRKAQPGLGESAIDVVREADKRSFLLRTFRGQDGGEGVARAFLSDRYDITDDLDALVAVLGAVQETDTHVEVTQCDLTDTRMYVRVTAPQVAAMAPQLLAGYRSPFTGETGSDNPVVFAGFEIRNSEVGAGAFSINPMVIVQICKNGMTFTKDAYRKVHLGAKMEQGVIKVSGETRRRNVELIRSQTKDAVRTFLDRDYVQSKISELEEKAGIPITASSAPAQVMTVCRKLSFTDTEAEGILGHFIQGGQVTAGGLMQAVTSFSQTLDNADRARHLDDNAVDVLNHFARV